jgi:hypothetical protein
MRGSRDTALLLGAPPSRAVGIRPPVHPAGMPPLPRTDCAPRLLRRRRVALSIVIAWVTWLLAASVAADSIPVTSASLRIDEDEVRLSAEFGLALTPALEEALEKGIPLYFTTEFELARARFLWFPEKVAQWSITYRISYSSLTRQYRVASGPLGQTFESLADVERFIGHVPSRPVARAEDLTKGVRYEAAVRIKLDVNQLPKPFQVNALASREWQLSSEWYRFTFTP